MSNIGKKLIEIKNGVTVEIVENKILVKGPKGSLEEKLPEGITLSIDNNIIKVNKESDEISVDKFSGLIASLVANMIKGVSDGFEKSLDLSGVGYRAKVEDNVLVLNVGFAAPVRMAAPNGISFEVNENVITVMGFDKNIVGNTAAIIRKIKPADPYKAKGIKYVGEIIRKKAGKAAKAVGGTK